MTITLWSPLAEPWTLFAFNDARAEITGQSGALVDGGYHGKLYNGHCLVFYWTNCDQDTILSLFSNCKTPFTDNMCAYIHQIMFLDIKCINAVLGKHPFKLPKEHSNKSHFTPRTIPFNCPKWFFEGRCKNSDNRVTLHLLLGPWFWYTTCAWKN